MGDFYRVIKTIKGRPYLYKQRTFRVGGKVCTESHYLGPAGAAEAARVRVEMALRKGGPSRAAVRKTIAALAAHPAPEIRWKKSWDNSRPVRQKVRLLTGLQKIIQGSGAVIIPNTSAFYNWTDDQIALPAQQKFHALDGNDGDQEFYQTALHELAHWTGHHSRLNRPLPSPISPNFRELYAQEELIAEATAIIIAEHMGYAPKSSALSARYFQGYLAQLPDRAAALARTEREAQRAAAFLIGRVNTTLAGDVKVPS